VCVCVFVYLFVLTYCQFLWNANRLWSLKRAAAAWMRMTYYKYIGHVAVHFRVRRLGCVMLRHWLQVCCAISSELLTWQTLLCF